MAKTTDLMARSAFLNNEAGELEIEAVMEEAKFSFYHTGFKESFSKLSDEQTQADYHYQKAYDARYKAQKFRKEAAKLERKARSIARRTRTTIWL